MQIKVQWWHNCKKPMKKVSYHFKIQHLVVETQTFSTEWFRTGGVIVFTNEPPSLLHQLPNCNRRCFQNEQGPKPRASLHAIKYRGTLLGKFTNGKKACSSFSCMEMNSDILWRGNVKPHVLWVKTNRIISPWTRCNRPDVWVICCYHPSHDGGP